MSDTLREKVARALCELDGHAFDKCSLRIQRLYLVRADAAIALVLEEAAREAECVVAYGESQAVMRENIAAAIRNLKDA